MNEVQTCAVARLILGLAGMQRFRVLAFDLALRLERGVFYSQTARQIMKRDYGVEVGDYSYGECFVPGIFPPGVSIGRYVSIGPGVRIFLRNHPLDRLSTHPFFFNSQLGFVSTDNINSGSLRIEHDAWIGAGTIIVKGCSRIGIGAVIGAGAVVTKDVPDFAIAVGNPARVLRRRFSAEVCRAVLESRWWEKSISECAAFMPAMVSSLEGIDTRHPLLRVAAAALRSAEFIGGVV